MTETPTDTTAQRAELVAYYERKRASAQQEADEMAVLGSTVRVLSDAAVDDEYRRMILKLR